MPTNKRENMYFGLMMCTGMVVIMTIYNLLITGLMDVLAYWEIFIQFVIGFVIAYSLEWFLVGPAAKKITFASAVNKGKTIHVVLLLSTLMVTGMVAFMSFYGLVMSYITNNLAHDSLVLSYFSLFVKNFIVALPVQLILVGPVVRFLFTKYFVKQLTTGTATEVN